MAYLEADSLKRHLGIRTHNVIMNRVVCLSHGAHAYRQTRMRNKHTSPTHQWYACNILNFTPVGAQV